MDGEGSKSGRLSQARVSPLPRPAFAVWPFQRTLLISGAGSREAGHGAEPLKFKYVAQLPRPASVLALMEDGAVALGLHQGPDLGVHHPAAHRFATGPAPPPATLARFATRVPVQEMRQVSPRLKPGEE